MTMHRFDPTILREYDIRGIVGQTLSETDARAIGRAFGTIIMRRGGKSVCIGYDGRLSSPKLEAAVVDGFEACGLEVMRIGMGPTPMLYYATTTFKADGGLMITGSHNPPDYNGFKMMAFGASFFGEDIQELGRVAASGDFVSGIGKVVDVPVADAYTKRLMSDYRGGRPLKVAWDAGNGATGDILKALVKSLPGTHILLNEKVDGTFPAHHPDPTEVENLQQLMQTVEIEDCDLGVAFDGDGDRIGVIDSQGRVLWGDQLMILFAEDVLKRHPGATIIADVKASQVLFDEIARMGGQPLMWKTGHSLIKAKMAQTGAPVAGEMSGHIFFKDGYYGFDDGLYAAIRVLDILARSDVPLSALRDRLPPMVNTPELRFPCPESRKFGVIQEVKQRLAAEGADVSDIDGVRVNTKDGWWLLRASNTQDVLVARCEAADEAGLERLKATLVAQARASGIEPPRM